MEKPKKCISVIKAKALQIKWKESRGKDIDLAQGYQDTREFWYSVEEASGIFGLCKGKICGARN